MSEWTQNDINREEVQAKIGRAIENCSYLNRESFPALVELVVSHAKHYGLSADEVMKMVQAAYASH